MNTSRMRFGGRGRAVPLVLVSLVVLLAAALAVAYMLVRSTESAPQTDDLFPPSIEHQVLPDPLTERFEWGPFVLVPPGWSTKNFTVTFPPDVAAKTEGHEREETDDVKLVTSSSLFNKYLSGTSIVDEYELAEVAGIAFGDAVTWLMATFTLNGERALEITLYPYVTGPIESNLPYGVHMEAAVVNGHRILVDIHNPSDPKSPANIRVLYGDLFLGIASEDIKSGLLAAQEILKDEGN